jgi:hypothetical protein
MIVKILTAFIILMVVMSGSPLLMLLAALIGGAILWFKSKTSAGEKEFLELPFVQKADYKHVFVNTAIAISKAERKVLLASGKSIKQYGFEDIKSWEYKSDPLMSLSDKIQHGMSYGFFVTVRDIDNPVWRIAFNQNDPKSTLEMQRWMEIFNQFVNND